MPTDIEPSETDGEQIDSSAEKQNTDGENNAPSKSESSNQSNWKKMQRKLKEERQARLALEAKLRKLEGGEDDTDDDDDDDLFNEQEDIFSDTKSEIFFLKNKDAEDYKEEMADLISENPRRKDLSLQDLFDLAKARYPKSSSNKNFAIHGGKGEAKQSDGKVDPSKMTAEQIAALSPSEYKKLFKTKK